jgi:glycosyltransferase involved in cell wall biosynthesis
MRDARIVYDGEAIAAERELERRRLAGETISPEAARQLVDEEVALAHDVDAVLTVSSSEEHHFTSRGITNVHVVSHKIPVTPTPKSFDERSGLLFVGAFNPLSPNADSVLWFAKEILPRVRELVGGDVPLLVAGHNPPKEVTALAGDDVRVLGSVADLAPLYDAARVFVAPTRYAAGIPFKVGHAAAHGLPVVATSLLARQLEWVHDRQLLAADTVEQFAVACASLYTDRQVWQRIRQGALEQIRDEYSVARFNAGLSAALSAAPAVATESVLAAS